MIKNLKYIQLGTLLSLKFNTVKKEGGPHPK